MTESMIIQLITTTGLIVVAWLGNRKLTRIGDDAKEAREQTANSHSSAEFPNLRDEVTAIHADVRVIAEITKGHDRHLDRIDRHFEDLHREDEHIESTIDRAKLNAERELQAAIEDRNQQITSLQASLPALVQIEVAKHLESCPLKNR